MKQNKICIVTTSLGKGGAERFSAVLSQLLFKLGYDVHLVITKNIIEYEYSGNLFNLELAISGKNKVLVLKSYFRKGNFDFIIDNRIRNRFFKEFLIYKFIFNKSNVISVVHSFYVQNYIPKSKLLAKLLYSNVYKIITVSETIKNRINSKYAYNNIIRVYNPIPEYVTSFKHDESINYLEDYILYFGRIDNNVKNLSLLINGYKESILYEKGIKLVFLGDGFKSDLDFLKKLVQDFSLEQNIRFIPFKPNPFDYVKKAMFTVLTSRYEGFPMSLIESLACGTPVISVDCDSGPSEIIENRKNGLLINNYDVQALAKAMNLFVEDKELYLSCKKNAFESVKHLEIDRIALQWKKILDKND